MAASSIQAKINGKSYAFPSNDKKLESVKVEGGPNPGELSITTRTDGKEQTIVCSADGWKRGTILAPGTGTALAPPAQRNIAATGAWTADDTYTARVVLYETPFVVTYSLRFSGDEVFYDSQMNVGRKDPQLVGRKP